MRATGSSNFVADALHRGRLEAHLYYPRCQQGVLTPVSASSLQFRNSLDQGQLFAQLSGNAGPQSACSRSYSGELHTPAGKGAFGAARGS